MKPLEFVRRWIDRHLAHEEALLLLVLLTVGLLLVMWLGGTLAPALTALVFAFILQGVVARLRSWGLGAQPAVWAAYGLFVTIVVLLLFFVLPLIGRQLYGFVEALPAILDQVQVFARGLPERYPTLLTQTQIDMGLEGAREEIVAAGQLVVEWLFSAWAPS
jgi:putative permease